MPVTIKELEDWLLSEEVVKDFIKFYNENVDKVDEEEAKIFTELCESCSHGKAYNMTDHVVECVRKVPWDDLWHVMYYVGEGESRQLTYDRVTRDDALAIADDEVTKPTELKPTEFDDQDWLSGMPLE